MSLTARDELTQHIVAEVERRADDALACLRGLLLASRDGEAATQAEVSRQLSNIGLHPETVIASGSDLPTVGEFAHPDEIDPSERSSIVAATGGVGPSLLIWAHPDGMPFDGGAGWTRDPYAGTVEDGRIYGWGIADDLSGVAAGIMTVDVLKGLGLERNGNLMIASTPSKGHASGILAVMRAGYVADAGVYLHPAESGHGLHDIKALAPGMLRFKVRVAGQHPDTLEPNHTLFAHLGADPMATLERVLSNLRELDAQRAARLHHPALAEMVGRSTGLLVSMVHAGESASRLPASAEAVVTILLPPGERLSDLQQEVERVVSNAATDITVEPSIDWLFGTTAAEVPADSQLYRAVHHAIEDVTGNTPRYYPGRTASEIRQTMLNYGMPSVGIGPLAGSLTQAGHVDEWLDVGDYLKMISVCALTAARWISATGCDKRTR